jgi:pyruvate dehydrogenase (quinone)
MARTAADVLADRLIDWGVRVIFGLPGDGINGIMEALRTRQEKITFIQVRHEEAAAFMACGYAKYTGQLGVCLATSGPGAIHLLNGLYDAKLDGAPVLAIRASAQPMFNRKGRDGRHRFFTLPEYHDECSQAVAFVE